MNCTANALIDAARCFNSIPNHMQQPVAISLLCEWANQGGGLPCLVTWTPNTEQANWTDANGNQTGDLAFFCANADIATVTVLNFSATAATINSLSNLNTLPSLQTLILDQFQTLNNLVVTGCTSLQVISCGGSITMTTITGLTDCVSLVQFVSGNSTALTALDFTGLANLTSIDASFCSSLTSITLTGCTALTTLDCSACDITGTLDVSPAAASLATLGCSSNTNLTALTLTGCTALTTVDCRTCDIIGTLDCNGLTSLVDLRCSDNVNMTGLDITGTDLDRLTCENNTGLITANLSGLGDLTDMAIELKFGSCSALTTLSFPNLTNVSGDFSLTLCTNLGSVSVPSLQTAGFIDWSDTAIAAASFPSLTAVNSGGLYLNSCGSLVTITANNLVSVVDEFRGDFCNSLTTVNATSLQTSGFYEFNDSPNLATFNAPATVNPTTLGFSTTDVTSLVFNNMTDCSIVQCNSTSLTTFAAPNTAFTNILDFTGASALTTLTLTNATFTDGFNLTFNGCALDAAGPPSPSIDILLARAVASGLTSGTIDLSGGTNLSHASWSAAALADETTLTTAGVTVLSNP